MVFSCFLRSLHLCLSYAQAKERHRWGIGGVKEAKGKALKKGEMLFAEGTRATPTQGSFNSPKILDRYSSKALRPSLVRRARVLGLRSTNFLLIST